MPPAPLALSKSPTFPAAARSFPLPVVPEELALVMPTLQPGAAALILFDETLRLLTLGESSAQTSKVAKHYLQQVSGGTLQAVTPALLPDTAAYLQSRLLVLFDLARREPQVHLAADHVKENPVSARWLSVAPRRVALLVRDLTNYLDTDTVDFRLRVLDLGGREAETVGQLEMGTDGNFVWDAGHGVLAVRKGNGVLVYGPALDKPLDHPLTRSLGAMLATGLRLDRLRLHPTRPLAVFSVAALNPSAQVQGGIWRASWEDPEAKEAKLEPLALLSPLEKVQLGEFSPEGGWLTYTQVAPGPARLFAQQVVDTRGPAFELGKIEDTKALLWTREPLALSAVAPGRQLVTRWAFGAAPGR